MANNRVWFYIDEEFMADTDKIVAGLSNERLIHHVVALSDKIVTTKRFCDELAEVRDYQIEKYEYRLMKVKEEMLRRMSK